MSRRLKLALVGCGAISDWHRRALENVAEIEITAAIDVDRSRAESAAKASGAAVFSSLAEALARGDFEAVDLMLPHPLHEPLTLEALAAGKHVLLEKPMATRLDACERMLAAARASDRVFMVAENAQYWPEVQVAQDAIASGAIGEVITARVQLFFPPMAAYYGGDRPWRLDRELAGGGLAIDTGSHYIRPLRIWMGEIEEVVAAMERPYAAMQGESLVRALFRFASGRVASFDLLLSQARMAPQQMFRITGSEGEITIDVRVRLFDAENPAGRVLEPETPQGYMLSYAGQFRDFARAVLEGTSLAAGPEVSLGELRTALAMERSARSKRWERVWT